MVDDANVQLWCCGNGNKKDRVVFLCCFQPISEHPYIAPKITTASEHFGVWFISTELYTNCVCIFYVRNERTCRAACKVEYTQIYGVEMGFWGWGMVVNNLKQKSRFVFRWFRFFFSHLRRGGKFAWIMNCNLMYIIIKVLWIMYILKVERNSHLFKIGLQ